VVPAVVVDRLGEIVLVAPGRPPRSFLIPGAAENPVRTVPAALERALRELPEDTPVRVDTRRGAEAVGRALGRTVPLATIDELRAARTLLPPPDRSRERRFLLDLAATELERVLNSPEEVLISLAREEERVGRAVGREQRAAEAFLAPEGSTLGEYARAWASVRSALERHHRELVGRTEDQARRVVPNLSAVVGARIAARLVAAAGGVAPLARMRAPRLQLLGSRRRPSPERGPRYGWIYGADRMGDVPPDRRGAYARSLGAIAAIAVRADAVTHADLSRGLVARRDRRVEQLRRQAR
jgi:snoRNA binding domain, fibrillarin